MGVGERVRRVLGSASPSEGIPTGTATSTEGATVSPGPHTAAEVAKEARAAGKRVDKLAKERAAIEATQELDELFQPEQWEELCNIYPDLRFIMTGWEGFRLTTDESKKMGVVTARCMRVLLKIDPAYIAVVLFVMNYGMMISKKEVAYRELVKRHKEAEALKARGLRPDAA